MPARSLFTYQDAVDHLMNFIGSEGDGLDLNFAREAVPAALNELSIIRDWTIYKTFGRIVSNVNQTTGTITYVQATRIATLSGATWPSWAAQGILLVGNVACRVDAVLSSTTLLLNSQQNFGSDIATPTGYQIYQNCYPMPQDFKCLIGDVVEVNSKIIVRPVTADRAFFDLHWRINPGQPWMYALVGNPSYQDSIGILFSAPPDVQRIYDFPYQRSPRALLTCGYTTGTVGVSGTSVSGTGTAFVPAHVGCVLRVSANGTAPTGRSGSNPFAEERIIVGYTSANNVTIDSAFAGNYPNNPFLISDPVDIDSQVMKNGFLRTAELQLATTRRPTDRGAIFQAWQKDIEEAMSADQKYRGERVAGVRGSLNWALRNLLYGQLGADVANNGH